MLNAIVSTLEKLDDEHALEKRVHEHKGAVKRHHEKNGIAVHAWTEQHRVDCQAATVKQVETNYILKKNN